MKLGECECGICIKRWHEKFHFGTSYFFSLGEASFYEERMSEFLMVSKSLEIKDLSTCIDMNDQTSSNQENTDHDNVMNVADDDLDINH